MKKRLAFRPEAARGLSRLTYRQRSAIEQAVEKLRSAPEAGREIENVCGGFREALAGNYRIYYLTWADRIEVTGLRRA